MAANDGYLRAPARSAATILGLLTDTELAKLKACEARVAAAGENSEAPDAGDAQVVRWMELLRYAGEVQLDGATTAAARAGLVTMGYFDEARALVILPEVT